MKVTKFIFLLVIALTYGLAPIWAVGFGFGSIIFVIVQILMPSTPVFLPALFYTLFLLSLIATTIQGRHRRETTLEAPFPKKLD